MKVLTQFVCKSKDEFKIVMQSKPGKNLMVNNDKIYIVLSIGNLGDKIAEEELVDQTPIILLLKKE